VIRRNRKFARTVIRRRPVKLNSLKITPKLGALVGVTILGLCLSGVFAGT